VWKERASGATAAFLSGTDVFWSHTLNFCAIILLLYLLALHSIHCNSIIYRDLKPNNVGFDVRGDIKIFDFGLAVEFDPAKAKQNGKYRLTGDTGTIRYMAPEGM
jgi:serine/threonine protein kinase